MLDYSIYADTPDAHAIDTSVIEVDDDAEDEESYSDIADSCSKDKPNIDMQC